MHAYIHTLTHSYSCVLTATGTTIVEVSVAYYRGAKEQSAGCYQGRMYVCMYVCIYVYLNTDDLNQSYVVCTYVGIYLCTNTSEYASYSSEYRRYMYVCIWMHYSLSMPDWMNGCACRGWVSAACAVEKSLPAMQLRRRKQILPSLCPCKTLWRKGWPEETSTYACFK